MRSWWRPLLLTTLCATLPASAALGFEVVILARTSSTDNGDCTATYKGTHTLQVLGIESGDSGEVFLKGTLYRIGNLFPLPAVASSCTRSGVLPQTNLLVCVSQTEHPCLNPNGPSFRAYSQGRAGNKLGSHQGNAQQLICFEH